MIIDLSTVLEKDYIKNYQAKSKILINKLKVYNEYILIVSINILNILEMDERFIMDESIEFKNNGIFRAGEICGFECYVDKFMNPDEIILTYDIVKMRDNKIDYLINNKNLFKEKRVKIIS